MLLIIMISFVCYLCLPFYLFAWQFLFFSRFCFSSLLHLPASSFKIKAKHVWCVHPMMHWAFVSALYRFRTMFIFSPNATELQQCLGSGHRMRDNTQWHDCDRKLWTYKSIFSAFVSENARLLISSQVRMSAACRGLCAVIETWIDLHRIF